MSRIEANVATQLGDVSRPQQAAHDAQQTKVDDLAQRNQSPESLAGSAVSADEVRSAAEQLKQVVEVASGRNLAFDIDDDTKELFVRVHDQESGEEIKQIPAEDVLDLRARIEEILGMFVDEKA